MKVFISSTVYDLRDLRSALEYHLTALGHEVLISEAGSFNPNQSANSYDACLQKIDECHLFVLLIGSRVGGRFPAGEEWISITRAEYRRAYQRASSGSLQLLTFVRKEVQDVITDRGALIRHLQQARAELQTADVQHAESPILRDAKHIMSFVAEVSRRDEMRSAISGTGVLPPANWVFQFTGFSEVLNPILQRLAGGKPLERLHLESCLKDELLANLRGLTQWSNGIPYSLVEMGRAFCESCPLRASLDARPVNRMALGKAVLNLMMLAPVIQNCSTTWLTKCLESQHFYDFDHTLVTYRRSPLLEFMAGLNRHLTGAKGAVAGMKVAEVAASFLTEIQSGRETVSVEPTRLMPLQLVWSLSLQAYRGSLGLYHHLTNGTTLDMNIVNAGLILNDESGMFFQVDATQERMLAEILRRLPVPPPITPSSPASATQR